jgi:glutamate-1-semialdehyde 2,1-aminomutase
VQAGLEMQRDGWWWYAPTITNQSIRRSILKETLFR